MKCQWQQQHKHNNWTVRVNYFGICYLLVKKEIKLNNVSSFFTWKKKEWKLCDPVTDICPTVGQQLNRPKYRMTAWGKERTEIISSVTHTELTTLQGLPLCKTHQVKQRLLQHLIEEDWVSMNMFSAMVMFVTASYVIHMLLPINYTWRYCFKTKKCVKSWCHELIRSILVVIF